LVHLIIHLTSNGKRLFIARNGSFYIAYIVVSKAQIANILAFFGLINYVALYTLMELNEQLIKTPAQKVIEFNFKQHICCCIPITSVAAQIKFGELRVEIGNGFPLFAWGAEGFEIICA